MVAAVRDLLRAHEMFDEMRVKGIEPTVVVYTILIRGLCSENKMEEAESMHRAMRKSGYFQTCILTTL